MPEAHPGRPLKDLVASSTECVIHQKLTKAPRRPGAPRAPGEALRYQPRQQWRRIPYGGQWPLARTAVSATAQPCLGSLFGPLSQPAEC